MEWERETGRRVLNKGGGEGDGGSVITDKGQHLRDKDYANLDFCGPNGHSYTLAPFGTWYVSLFFLLFVQSSSPPPLSIRFCNVRNRCHPSISSLPPSLSVCPFVRAGMQESFL